VLFSKKGKEGNPGEGGGLKHMWGRGIPGRKKDGPSPELFFLKAPQTGGDGERGKDDAARHCAQKKKSALPAKEEDREY